MRAWRGLVDGALLRSLGASAAYVTRFAAEAGPAGAELLVDECVAVWASTLAPGAGGRPRLGADAWWLAQALLDPRHRESIRLELSREGAALAAAAGADLWPFTVPSADDAPWGWRAWDDRGRWSLYRLRGCAFELRYERLGPVYIGTVYVAGRPMEAFSSSLGLAWGEGGLFWHLAHADLRALLELAPACDWDAWEFEPLTSAQRYEDFARRFPR